MKKTMYIIPALGESCDEKPYQKLSEALLVKGYTVKPVNPDWYAPLTTQVFKVEKTAIVFGFSFWAILAYLIAKKYPYSKAIFASISPLHIFSFKSLESDYRRDIAPKVGKEKAEILATDLAKDIKSITIDLKSLKIPYVTLSGALERYIPADIKVPKTGHELTEEYIEAILKLV